MKALRFEKNQRVFLMLEAWTELKAPRPALFRQDSLHVPAQGQVFPTPERVEGERYRIPVR